MALNSDSGLQRGVVLAEQCRFRVGGPADHYLEARTPGELCRGLDLARERGWPTFVYSGGTNLFFADAGFRGLVIRYLDRSLEVAPELPAVRVGAGCPLPDLVRHLAGLDWGGLDFLANIPGSVGGALVGNAGCYGRSISEVLRSVTLWDREGERELAMAPAECGFAYRHSRFKEEERWLILAAELDLLPGEGGRILQEAEEELARRRAKHPHDGECAGSFFKNPGDSSAWRLITEAGLAGERVGGAGLDGRHANFLVNLGGATSADIKELVIRIREGVRQRLGVTLQPEVRYIGPRGPEPF